MNAACTNLNPDGTRRHIRAALEAGASCEEILFVLKAASLMAIHSCSLGAPILLEEAKAAGVAPAERPKTDLATPACDAIVSARREYTQSGLSSRGGPRVRRLAAGASRIRT